LKSTYLLTFISVYPDFTDKPARKKAIDPRRSTYSDQDTLVLDVNVADAKLVGKRHDSCEKWSEIL
jgi:hypothetical protein